LARLKKSFTGRSLAYNGPSALPRISLSTLWTSPGRNRQVRPVISELIQAKLTPLFPNYYGPLTSITTPKWHYIAGGKAGEEFFQCCTNAPELDNLANTEEGRRVCRTFKKELEITETRNQVAGGAGSPRSLLAP